jgi:P450-derived glycosyltransferase activator
MADTAALRQLAAFTAELYRAKVALGYQGYLRHDELALLMLHPGRDNPYPLYERLRERGPLTRSRVGQWVTPSHRTCNAVLRDRKFGVVLDGTEGQSGGGLSFLEMNPPDHTRLRRLAAPAFSPKKMAGYTALIEKTVQRLLDELPADGAFDLVADFSAPLPIAVISDLLGVPSARAEEFARWGATIGTALDGVKGVRHLRALMQANAGLERLFEQLFEQRRRQPAEDVISTVVAAEGETISPAEMLPICVLLFIAGFETTVNLISNAVMALLAHPEQWAALHADPSLAAGTVEEVLRYDPPVQRTVRVALVDTELDGVELHRGEYVVALTAAANRDPAVYDEPARFDIRRQPSAEHLAFSSGIHYCLGAPLARAEATIALGALAERFPALRQHGRVVRRNASTIRGPLHLPVASAGRPA